MKPRASVGTEVASFALEGTLGELVLNGHGPRFSVWNDGCLVPECDAWNLSDGSRLVPPDDKNGLLALGVVLLPSGPIPYGTVSELDRGLEGFIHRYWDIPLFWEKLAARYVRLSWVYDRFSALPYLRLLGEFQSGKTRGLQVLGHLAYRGILAGGSTTASPLFRLLHIFRGTFLLDEADWVASGMTSDIVKILNSGYCRPGFVLRSVQGRDDYSPMAFNVFGPKIIASRREFEDEALESRCITLRMVQEAPRPDIPKILPPEFFEEAQVLRNRLLSWRMHTWGGIHAVPRLGGGLPSRMEQIAIPLCSIDSGDSCFCEDFIKFLRGEHSKQSRLSPLPYVVEAMGRLTTYQREWPATLTVKAVAQECEEVSTELDADLKFSPKLVGGHIRSLGFDPTRASSGYQFNLTQSKLSALKDRYQL